MAANIELQNISQPLPQLDDEEDNNFDFNATENRSFGDRTLSDRVQAVEIAQE